MRPPAENAQKLAEPLLLSKATPLAEYLKTLSAEQIAKIMAISPPLAAKTHDLIGGWSARPKRLRSAIDSFLGDIYSGLQVGEWSAKDRQYANRHLRILSGLYGILQPLDGIYPYRLEMGYRLPDEPYANLYKYWGPAIAETLPAKEPIVNLAAVEYSKIVTAFVNPQRLITPSFLTVSPKTGQPTFVVVHAKIARGALAAWLIKNRVDNLIKIKEFAELGYKYNASLSTPQAPVFVCQKFGGLGLSVRLK